MNDLSRDGWLVSVVGEEGEQRKKKVGVWAEGCRGWSERVDEPGSEVG